MEKIKVLVIDPFAKMVVSQEIENTLKAKQEIVGGLIELAHHFQNEDVCYVNEEGMFAPERAWFAVVGAHQPFTGRAVIVGSDDKGNDLSCKTTPMELMQKLRFFSDIEIQVLTRGQL